MSQNSSAGQKRGPKPRVIDEEQLQTLAMMQCTQAEIAAVLKFSQRGFEKRLAQSARLREIWEQGKLIGCVSMKRAQFQAGVAGNVTAQIWWGKQYLGQRDNVDSIIAGPHGPLEFTVNPGEQLLAELAGIAARRLAKGSPGPAA